MHRTGLKAAHKNRCSGQEKKTDSVQIKAIICQKHQLTVRSCTHSGGTHCIAAFVGHISCEYWFCSNMNPKSILTTNAHVSSTAAGEIALKRRRYGRWIWFQSHCGNCFPTTTIDLAKGTVGPKIIFAVFLPCCSFRNCVFCISWPETLTARPPEIFFFALPSRRICLHQRCHKTAKLVTSPAYQSNPSSEKDAKWMWVTQKSKHILSAIAIL